MPVVFCHGRRDETVHPGMLFVSNHIAPAPEGQTHLPLTIVELMTRTMGYPTHQMSEVDLKTALTAAGFGRFRTECLDKQTPFPVVLLAAVKLQDVEQ